MTNVFYFEKELIKIRFILFYSFYCNEIFLSEKNSHYFYEFIKFIVNNLTNQKHQNAIVLQSLNSLIIIFEERVISTLLQKVLKELVIELLKLAPIIEFKEYFDMITIVFK